MQQFCQINYDQDLNLMKFITSTLRPTSAAAAELEIRELWIWELFLIRSNDHFMFEDKIVILLVIC